MNGLVLLALVQAAGPPAPTLLDGFEHAETWTAHPADGVGLRLSGDRGRVGRALRLDFSFTGGGYAIARRSVSLDLPANYAFSFWIRGEAKPNTLEFKLIDRSGDNVWWYTEPDRVFDGAWHRITIRKRQVRFAWGPRGGGDLDHVAALELVITAGRGGGAGRVWLDELTLTPRPEAGPYELTPRVTASSALVAHAAAAILDGDTATSWRGGAVRAAVTIDFLRSREYGGLTLVWDGPAPAGYTVRNSDDGTRWQTIARGAGTPGPRDYVYLPEIESRFLRLDLVGIRGGAGIREVRVEPLEWSASRNAFLTAIAAEAPRGSYPRYLSGERGDWTVVGVDGALEEALLGEDGALEAGTGAWTVEPFVSVGGRLLTWNEVRATPSLEQSRLPIPSVEWRAEPVSLTVTAFAVGSDTGSSIVARYRVRNRGAAPLTATLYLAIRPFQVNPPWQFLGTPGGVARVDSLRWDGGAVRVNADRAVIPVGPSPWFGAMAFGAGDIVGRLRQGALPLQQRARDSLGLASGALAWRLTVAPGDSATVAIEIPLASGRRSRLAGGGLPGVERALASAASRWEETLDRATISLPAAGRHIANSVASTLGYILINRDGPALQPGSRSYQRSWIRDGALTGAALLRFGHADAVRDFIRWYAGYQYPGGKIPCCVDRRGADPVPEHDSHGEFIYLVMEYFRHTGDRALLRDMWPRVRAAAGYIDSLRQTRRTPSYQSGVQRVFYGLLPPSISHEGYSAKPMHSYWDDFFALRGLKDAAAMAAVLGSSAEAALLGALRDEFARDLYASIALAMTQHGIDYIPGAADLGDFDATSTTIAVSPGGELGKLPEAALERTFERYWRQALARRDTTTDKWEAYTPYELRTVGTLLRMGQKARALDLLDGFMKDQEPPAWNQWPEVVWRAPRAAKFIGDLPHTWVGSDFLRSVSDLFVYEREADSALVVGAGIPEPWLLDSGVAVSGLSTWWGLISYTAVRHGNSATIALAGGLRIPPGGIVVHPPGTGPVTRVTVDGTPVSQGPDGEVVLRSLPARVSFER
ncbi:MAG TPA: discoidin domain-containing protein [Gemmatimonadales bacterium]|nr:discoidin domain-containing protein [Gemmatimonadales bacterium]